MLNSTRILLFAALLAASFMESPIRAYAEGGHGSGNGGDAIYRSKYLGMSGDWILLDLAEAGIEESPRFQKALQDYSKRYANRKLSLVRGFVEQTFRDKRFTVKFKDGLAAAIESSGEDRTNLIAVMRLYEWQLTNQVLRNIGDEHSTIDLEKVKSAQLAVRLDDRIQLYAPIFLNMSLLNQVATIYHEIAYALTRPLKNRDGELFQPSWRARSWVATYFAGSPNHHSFAATLYGDQRVFTALSGFTTITHFADLVVDDRVTQVYEGPLNIVVSKIRSLDSRYGLDGPYLILPDGRLDSGSTSAYEIFPMQYRDRTVSIPPRDTYEFRDRYRNVCSHINPNSLFGAMLPYVSIRNRFGWKLDTIETEFGTSQIPTVRRMLHEDFEVFEGVQSGGFTFAKAADCSAESFENALRSHVIQDETTRIEVLYQKVGQW